MRTVVSIIFLIILSSTAHCQEASPYSGHVVFASGTSGPGGVLSLYYERDIFQRRRWFGFAGAGIGHLPRTLRRERYVAIPAGFHLVTFRGKHHKEFGAGLSYINGNLFYLKNDPPTDYWKWHGLFFTSSIGYRYQKPESGLVLRCNLHMMNKISEGGGGHFMYSQVEKNFGLGFSIGYFFKKKGDEY